MAKTNAHAPPDLKVLLAILVTCVIVLFGIITAPFWLPLHDAKRDEEYQQIKTGMTVADVERLIGTRAAEIDEDHLPTTVDGAAPANSPTRLKPIVVGERFFRFKNDARTIIFSVTAGVVREKWFWEPSL